MASPIDDENDILIEKIVPDFDDDTYDIGANDDAIKDDEADQGFDEELNKEFESGTPVVPETVEPIQFDDDEEKDSVIEESDTSDIEGKSSLSSPIIAPVSIYGFNCIIIDEYTYIFSLIAAFTSCWTWSVCKKSCRQI